ncbi:carboxypeptidase Q isoform X4 [Passer domesticus]|uniref:carboxypeptidase Q isoform X4 n=1 Tax=Passer domesticus TaxID=48849 RepID=UPI0030FF01C5
MNYTSKNCHALKYSEGCCHCAPSRKGFSCFIHFACALALLSHIPYKNAIIESSQHHRMVWVGRDLENCLVPISCHGLSNRPSVEKKKEKKMKHLFLIFLMNLLHQHAGKSLRRDGSSLKSFEDIKNEIAGYTDIAKAIIDLAVHGKAQNRSYDRLAVFADTIGPRLSGSKNLEAAIKYMFTALQKDGLENVHLEPVKVPHWERGEEFAVMLEPRNHSIAILGLGSSIATPPEGITAEVIVVASFDELHKRAQEAKGKIVVYNEPFISYGETVQYRLQGAVEAAKVGAVASLIRSVASFSIHSPHTGVQSYQPGVPQIPTACITVEDAEMMSRMSLRGTKIVVHLRMGAKTYPDSLSFNTVAEIVGSKYPEQVVLVSGHLDSWDVGQGAMDDGGGAFISWEALSLIKDLGLRPKRTLRLVLWTAEEQGGVGAEQYYQLHKVPACVMTSINTSGFIILKGTR